MSLENMQRDEHDLLSLTLIEEFGDRSPGMIIKFQVGDTVKVTSPDMCTGHVGEVDVIDERYSATGEIYGVYLDAVASTVFFSDDEIEKAGE